MAKSTAVGKKAAVKTGLAASQPAPAPVSGSTVATAMPTTTATKETEQMILEVSPEHVLTDPDVKGLREWTGSTPQELRIPELARTIYEEGQKYPCLTRETPDGFMMIDGERRRAAVQMIRENVDGLFGDGPNSDFPLRIIVDELAKDDSQALRATFITTTQREDFNAIEYARGMGYLRKKFGWEGGKGTVEVASFLGVSPATVTQSERLLKLPADIQDSVKNRRITPTAALEMATSPVEKMPEVAAKAQELANKDAEKKREKLKKTTDFVSAAVKEKGQKKKDAAAAKNGGKSATGDSTVVVITEPFVDGAELAQDQSAEDVTEHTGQTARDAVESERTRLGDAALVLTVPTIPPPHAQIEGQHVRQAQKMVEGALTKPKAPKMNEAAGLFEQWDGPAYPEVMRKFAAAFVLWTHGKLSVGGNPDKALEAAWDDVADQVSGEKSGDREDGKEIGSGKVITASKPTLQTPTKPKAAPVASKKAAPTPTPAPTKPKLAPAKSAPVKSVPGKPAAKPVVGKGKPAPAPSKKK